MLLTTIFCDIDDFCKHYEKFVSSKRLKNKSTLKKGGRPRNLSLSEVLTICIYFHFSGYHTFKRYYKDHVCIVLKSLFGILVSYNRFVELMREAAEPMLFFAATRNSKNISGIAFIDSTKLPVCSNLRIYSHKVFKGIAARGKSSTGWFYGFKLHIVINHVGEILSFWVTPGNVDDRNANVIKRVTKNLWGLLFGDRGYISKPLFEKLYKNGLKLVTKIKKNMENKLMNIYEKLLLKKRNIIESTNNILKNSMMVDHTRHRSIHNFCTNLFSAIAGYSYRQNKPAISKSFLTQLNCS